MSSRDVFDTYYKSAEVLLRVYRLFESDDGPTQNGEMLGRYRQVLQCTNDEELILILNELFVGVVRERADMRPAFFRKDNLDLLLRQSVVAAASAMDIFVPNLLETFLPNVVRIKQRNFMPNNGEVRQLFSEFRFRLEDIWPLMEEADLNTRWDMLSRRVLEYCRSKTLTNDSAIAAALALLGVEQPWAKIAARAGENENALRDRFKRVVTRRNDIVHRADRPARDPEGPVTAIDRVWAENHVGAVKTVAHACYDLARERVRELELGVTDPIEAAA